MSGERPYQPTVLVGPPPQGTPPPQWSPPPPRPRDALPTALAALISLVTLASLMLGALAVVTRPAGSDRATWRGAPSPTEAGTPPTAGAPESEWVTWVRRSANIEAGDQADALLAGDEDGYLAVVDPDSPDLRADLRRRFSVLSAMGPGAWTQRVTGLARPSGNGSWSVRLRVGYCFGDPNCQTVQFDVDSVWRLRGERLMMAGLDESGDRDFGPRPWETDDLAVRVGDRVVLATAQENSWRLTQAVKSADTAALVADRFAKWSPPPSRYVVFLAGPRDWNRWYGEDQPEWAAGYTLDGAPEVVVRADNIAQRDLGILLAHEFTHVTTLSGADASRGSDTWWLREGIADYATMIDYPVSDYDAIGAVRSFVRKGWDQDPAVTAPSASASLDEAAARYGIAFLSVRAISEEYTETKMLDFFGRIVHEGESLYAASLEVLGASWETVQAQCVDFIKDTVS